MIYLTAGENPRLIKPWLLFAELDYQKETIVKANNEALSQLKSFTKVICVSPIVSKNLSVQTPPSEMASYITTAKKKKQDRGQFSKKLKNCYRGI